MLLAMMRECRNFFISGKTEGDFAISEAALSPMPLGVAAGQYLLISGSALNDGVWKRLPDGRISGDFDPADETFYGTVYALKVPRDFVSLSLEIASWQEKASGKAHLASESFGMYSYSAMQSAGGGAITWQETFKARLLPFRKMFSEVRL